jgi:hypothetical protein
VVAITCALGLATWGTVSQVEGRGPPDVWRWGRIHELEAARVF